MAGLTQIYKKGESVMKIAGIVKLVGVCCIISLITACGKTEPVSIEAYSQSIERDEQGIDVYGEVKTDRNQAMIIDFPATVLEVYMRDGENVKKGDKLVTLDFEAYKREIKTKENEIGMDEIKLKELQANNNPQILEANRIKEELRIKQNYVTAGEDPELQPLQNSLDIIGQNILLAKKEYETNKELFEMEYISEAEFKKSEQVLKSREKEKEDALTAIQKKKTDREIEINALNTQLKSIEMQFNNANQEITSSIDTLKLKIDNAKLMLESMKSKLNKDYIKGNDIIAPEDNLIIYDINCMKGTYINSESKEVLKAMYVDTIYIMADIPEESIASVSIGNTADITLVDEKEEIKGEVSKISSRAIEKDGDTIIEAVIEVEEGKEFLRPGLTVDIKINF